MGNGVRRLGIAGFAAFGLVLSAASAGAQVTGFDRLLSRLDFGVSGKGEITKGVSGTAIFNGAPTAVTQNASTTVGALATLRYTRSPLLGLEANYGYARFTENFSNIGGAQTNSNEYTAGYVAHTPTLLGVEPFVSVGLGTVAFKPTPRGGRGLLTQYRAAYYYSVGFDDLLFSEHFGIRASIRQVFLKAPDFGANYLTTQQRTFVTEPTAGFFVRF